MMRRMRGSCVLSLLVLVLTAPIAAQDQEKKDNGQADLDQATELKLNARTLRDLEEVARLCEAALDKGLDADNTQFAKQLLAATLYQRAERISEAILQQQVPAGRIQLLRRAALTDLKKVVENQSDFGEAYVLIARLELIDGDRQKGMEAVTKALELFKADNKAKSEILTLRARLGEEREKILADLDEAIKLDPENTEAVQTRALLALQNSDFEKAAADLAKLLEADQENIGLHLTLAEALSNMQKFDEALKHANAAVDLQPEASFPYVLRARIRVMNNDNGAALDDLDKAITLQPNDLDALLLRARLNQAAGNLENARRDVDRVLQQQPEALDAILVRTMIYAAEGKFQEAIGDLKKLVEAEPDNVDLRLQLGLFHSAADQPRKAIAVFDEMLKSDADNWQVLRARADAYLSIGKHEEAIADYEVALKQQPENASILNNFAWVLATSPDDELRDGKRSIELGTKACEVTEYKQAHILSTLAAGYAEVGDFETAIKWSRKAVEAADEDNRQQLAEELESYQQSKPWRERQETEEKDAGT